MTFNIYFVLAPLYIAVQMRNIEIVQALLKRDDIDINLKSDVLK